MNMGQEYRVRFLFWLISLTTIKVETDNKDIYF